MATSSFVKVLARHDGPWRLAVSMPADHKGRRETMWLPERRSDPIGDALAFMSETGVDSVSAWSESEGQFVMTITPDDAAVWAAEGVNWREAIKAARKEVKEALPARPVKLPPELKKDDVERVLELRATGMGYVHIEAELGIEGKKGFWAWKIVKANEASKKK